MSGLPADKRCSKLQRLAWYLALWTCLPSIFLVWPTASPAQKSPITAIAFTPNGQLLVGSNDGLLLVAWPTLETIETIKTSLAEIDRIAFSPTGDSIVIAGGIPGEVGQWEEWSWPSLQRRILADGHADVISDFDFDADGNLVTCSLDGDIRLQLATPKPKTLTGHSKSVLSLRTLTGTQLAVSAGRDQSVRVWDLEKGDLVRSLNQHTGEVRALAVRPTVPNSAAALPMVASAGTDRTLRFWQPTIGRMVRFLRLPSSPLAITWDPSGTRVIAASEDGHVRMINATTLAIESDVEVSPGWIYTLALAPAPDRADGAAVELAVGTASGEVKRVVMRPQEGRR